MVNRRARISQLRTQPVEPALADWANDDLLISDVARNALRTDHPRIAELMDWPDLRALFQQHDAPANLEKRHARAAGRRAVCLAFLAFARAALGGISTPTASQAPAWSWSAVIGLLTAALAITSFAGGLLQMFYGSRKTSWMVERLWTETIRRFYYQFILRHIDLALAVLAGAKPLSDWHSIQANALRILLHEELPRPHDTLRDVLDDEPEIKVWTLTAWQTVADLPSVAPGPDLDELLTILERKRLKIQKDYSARKLRGSRLALSTKTMLVRSSFYILVFLVLALNAAIGLLRARTAILPALPDVLTALVTIAAVLSAAIVAAQMWDRGERVTNETERLTWFLAGVENIHRRYTLSITPDEKIAVLVELEELAYQEMRQFLVSVDQSIFVAG